MHVPKRRLITKTFTRHAGCGPVFPAAAANHALEAVVVPQGVGDGFLGAVITATVLAPLVDIPMHVKQAPTVWHLDAAGSRIVGIKHCILPESRGISTGIRRLSAGPAGILPLGYSQQTISVCA